MIMICFHWRDLGNAILQRRRYLRSGLAIPIRFDADAGGADLAGSPLGLVSALRKIESASKVVPLDANPATAHMFIIKPFSAGAMLSLFSTHPPTEQRIQALLQHSQL